MGGGIKTETWVAWLAGAFVVGVSAIFIAMSYVYANFETVKHADERDARMQAQLNRIEDKIDDMGEFPPGWKPIKASHR